MQATAIKISGEACHGRKSRNSKTRTLNQSRPWNKQPKIATHYRTNAICATDAVWGQGLIVRSKNNGVLHGREVENKKINISQSLSAYGSIVTSKRRWSGSLIGESDQILVSNFHAKRKRRRIRGPLFLTFIFQGSPALPLWEVRYPPKNL